MRHALRRNTELWQRALNNLYDRNLLSVNLKIPFLHIYNFGAHFHAYQIKFILGELEFSQYWVFSFVRNPWDREVSEYHYALRNPNHRQHHAVKNLADFDEFIDWRFSTDIKNCKTQRSYLQDIDGKLLVDYVGKVHTLEADLERICKKLKIKKPDLERKNKSEHERYDRYYSTKTIEMVAKVYKEDVDEFGFNFGD